MIFLLALLPATSQATPKTIRVDGSVFDNAGVPVTASKDIQIKAYDSASGGSLLWTSSVYNTAVSAGKFTINLDAAAGSPSLVDRLGERTASQAIYFQIEVDSGAANGSMDTPTIVLPRMRARGTAFALTANTADALKGVTATTAEMNYLAGISANVQTQINTLSAGSSAGKVDKTGDSMSGVLQVGANITSTGTVTAATLNSTAATASRFALFDSSKNLTSSSASVTDAEFGYLSGVTSNLGANLNGLTANVQTQINGKQATLAYEPVSKLGDSMSGALSIGANITSTGTVTAATINGTGLTASRAVVTDASKNLVSSTVSDTEIGYLSGASASVQTQLNSLQTQISSLSSGGTSAGAGNPSGGRTDCTSNNGGNGGNGGATLITGMAMPSYCIENTIRTSAAQTTAATTCSGLGGGWGLCRQEEVTAACWFGYWRSTTNSLAQSITQNRHWTADMYNGSNAIYVGPNGCSIATYAATTTSYGYRCCLR